MTMNDKNLECALHGFLDGRTPQNCQILKAQPDQRGGLLRVTLHNGGTIVAKVWRIRNLKDRFKSITHVSNGQREWGAHRLVYKAGIATPEPISFFHFSTKGGRKAEVMVVEDLGFTESSLFWLKQLITSGDEQEVESFEDKLIDITVRLVNLGLVDVDHQLNNLVVDKHGRLFRIDFECTKRCLLRFLCTRRLAKMTARFITGHIHAVQPDVDRSIRFTKRLYTKIHAVRGLKLKISKNVDKNLLYQRRKNGVDTRVTLPT